MTSRYTRLAPSGTVQADAASRVVNYTFSDESVGRDGHIVRADAWQLSNFEKNPVFLWAHDDSQPPIGRVFGLNTQARALHGGVRYAETDFADTIYQLVRGGFLSAVSTSWQPLAFDRMSDGTGLIFTDVDLLEISQVPIPALPTALATARGRVGLKPLYEWAERALDTGRLGAVDRSVVEAVCRAARPARTPSVDDGAAARLARARELQARGSLPMLSETEQSTFDRYKVLHYEHGYSVDKVAFHLGMTSNQLRALVARGHQANPPKAAPSESPRRNFTEADRGKLRGIERHLASADGSHASLSHKHGRLTEHLSAAKAAHRELTSTLRALGERRGARSTSTLEALGYDHDRVTRALSSLKDSLGAIQDVHGEAEDHADAAHESVQRARSSVNGIMGSN